MLWKKARRITGYVTVLLLGLNVYDSSSWHIFKPENGHVGQVVAKNNLYLCKEHI